MLEVYQAVSVILSLIIIEGLLSVDNALAIAAMASHLPGEQKYRALRWGIIGAYVFRGLALAFAWYIIDNPWLKIVGAAYLIHLMASFFAEQGGGKDEHADEKNISAKMAGKGFWSTVVAIEIMDLSLSVDNVVAAVALSRNLWVVCAGVFIGILALRFVAGYCIKLIERFPILESTAFILIGYVGGILVVEVASEMQHHPIVVHAYQKFIGIVIIVAVSLWYSEVKAVRTALWPVCKVLRTPLMVYAAVSNLILNTIFYPFKLVADLFRKAPGKDGEVQGRADASSDEGRATAARDSER